MKKKMKIFILHIGPIVFARLLKIYDTSAELQEQIQINVKKCMKY